MHASTKKSAEKPEWKSLPTLSCNGTPAAAVLRNSLLREQIQTDRRPKRAVTVTCRQPEMIPTPLPVILNGEECSALWSGLRPRFVRPATRQASRYTANRLLRSAARMLIPCRLDSTRCDTHWLYWQFIKAYRLAWPGDPARASARTTPAALLHAKERIERYRCDLRRNVTPSLARLRCQGLQCARPATQGRAPALLVRALAMVCSRVVSQQGTEPALFSSTSFCCFLQNPVIL
jgi:hypothetical protein